MGLASVVFPVVEFRRRIGVGHGKSVGDQTSGDAHIGFHGTAFVEAVLVL